MSSSPKSYPTVSVAIYAINTTTTPRAYPYKEPRSLLLLPRTILVGLDPALVLDIHVLVDIDLPLFDEVDARRLVPDLEDRH